MKINSLPFWVKVILRFNGKTDWKYFLLHITINTNILVYIYICPCLRSGCSLEYMIKINKIEFIFSRKLLAYMLVFRKFVIRKCVNEENFPLKLSEIMHVLTHSWREIFYRTRRKDFTEFENRLRLIWVPI